MAERGDAGPGLRPQCKMKRNLMERFFKEPVDALDSRLENAESNLDFLPTDPFTDVKQEVECEPADHPLDYSEVQVVSPPCALHGGHLASPEAGMVPECGSPPPAPAPTSPVQRVTIQTSCGSPPRGSCWRVSPVPWRALLAPDELGDTTCPPPRPSVIGGLGRSWDPTGPPAKRARTSPPPADGIDSRILATEASTDFLGNPLVEWEKPVPAQGYLERYRELVGSEEGREERREEVPQRTSSVIVRRQSGREAEERLLQERHRQERHQEEGQPQYERLQQGGERLFHDRQQDERLRQYEMQMHENERLERGRLEDKRLQEGLVNERLVQEKLGHERLNTERLGQERLLQIQPSGMPLYRASVDSAGPELMPVQYEQEEEERRQDEERCQELGRRLGPGPAGRGPGPPGSGLGPAGRGPGPAQPLDRQWFSHLQSLRAGFAYRVMEAQRQGHRWPPPLPAAPHPLPPAPAPARPYAAPSSTVTSAQLSPPERLSPDSSPPAPAPGPAPAKGKRGRPRKHAPKLPLPPLYVFIRNLLHSPAYNPSTVAWVDQAAGCFKVTSTAEFARTWGRMKSNRSEEMNYEKMSRAMRYHYGCERQGRKGHLAMVKEKRLYYRFGELARNWRPEETVDRLRSPCSLHPLCRSHICLWTKE